MERIGSIRRVAARFGATVQAAARRHERAWAWGAALAALAAGACGESNDGSLGEGSYVVSTTIFAPEGQTSLLALIDNPSEPLMLDTARAAEIGGSTSLFGGDGRGVFALGSSDGPTVTRYEVNDAGELVAGESMSLAELGIASGFKRANLVPFVSDTRAYWLDDVTAQAIVWDPSSMTVTSTFSLAAANRAGWTLEFGEAVLRADRVFLGAAWRGTDESDFGQALVLVLDAQTDSLLEVITDDRCGQTVEIAAGADGALYFSTGTLGASFHALQYPAGYPAPCMLRIPAGQTHFDPDFYVDITQLTGGLSGGGLVAGLNGHAYFKALHPDLLDAPIGPDTELFAPYDAVAWRWWRFRLGDSAPAELVADIPAASAGGQVLHAGGRDYFVLANYTTMKSVLLSPAQDGSLQPGLEVTGFPYGLIKLH